MYRNKGNRQKNNKKGFTLVELVVILVILAILMAILVPSLVGYIRKAKTQQAFAECRSCVIAAQSIASETYGKDKSDTLNWGTPSSDYTAVQTMAEVPTDSKIDTISTNTEQYLVTYLSYTTGDLTVIYERDHNPEYYLQEEPGWSVDAKKDVSAYQGYGDALKGSEYNSITDRWNGAVKWMEDNNINSLPTVSKSVLKKAGFKETDVLYWRPYYIDSSKKSGQIVYYASVHSGRDESGWIDSERWKASITMIDGKIYYLPQNSNGKIQETYIASWNNAKTYEEATKEVIDRGFTELK